MFTTASQQLCGCNIIETVVVSDVLLFNNNNQLIQLLF